MNEQHGGTTGDRLTPAERLALQALVDWDKAGHHGPEYHNLALAATAYRQSTRPAIIVEDITLWVIVEDGDAYFELDPALPSTAAGRSIVLHPDGTWTEGE